MDWEDSRSEFFQESYPCDRSVSDSVGASNTSTGRRTVLDGGTGTPGAREGTLESIRSTVVPVATAVATDSVLTADGLVASRTTATKPRMRAAVQGLDDEDSDDGEIEVVDFTDGMVFRFSFEIKLLSLEI